MGLGPHNADGEVGALAMCRRIVRAGGLPAVLAVAALLLSGCVTSNPSYQPNGRQLFVPNPYPRSNLADTGEIPFEISGTNWGADQALIIDQCAFIKGEPDRCERIGTAVTGVDGSFPLTTVMVHYLLNVNGTSVPCDAEVDPDQVLGGVGTFFGGRFYSKHCSVRVANNLDPDGGLQVWIAFSGHES